MRRTILVGLCFKRTVAFAAVAKAGSRPSSNAPAPSSHGFHIPPQSVLESLLESMTDAQKKFLSGDKEAGRGHFFDVVNDTLKPKMLGELGVEVRGYVVKRQEHYARRLSEETEEFRRERREIHDELYRAETEKHKEELNADIASFTTARQKEYDDRLSTDVTQYNGALKAYRAGHGKKDEGNGLEKNLNMDVAAIAKGAEVDSKIYDFGSKGNGLDDDLTDEDIRTYVEHRLKFYEKSLRQEIEFFVNRRRTFYEELLQARAIRHAAKIRADTEHFREGRKVYYKGKLRDDAQYFEKALQEHYEKCFLQCYANEVWYSLGGASRTLAGLTAAQLLSKVPLMSVLTSYENQAIEEITRDAFLKAARRVAENKLTEGASAAMTETRGEGEAAEEEEVEEFEEVEEVEDE